MINNLASYFESEQEYYLQSIKYDRIVGDMPQNKYDLNCTDTISTEAYEEGKVRLTLKRKVAFKPEDFFELSIEFGAILSFKKEKKGEIDWDKVNLEDEFRNNGSFVLANLASRISLLIAEITSSFGQQPIILPVGISNE
ncbi:MAG: hypothetical protein Q4C92_00515 [Clostridia bacterium]|nr:hypothetical protein [Clostridia bacterium]